LPEEKCYNDAIKFQPDGTLGEKKKIRLLKLLHQISVATAGLKIKISVSGPEQTIVSKNLDMKHSQFRQRHSLSPMSDTAQSCSIFQTW